MLFSHNFKITITSTFIVMLIIISCEQNIPPAIWNPDVDYGLPPTIENVDPDSAIGGVNEIIILGENFSPIKDSNIVYYKNQLMDVKSASESEIVFYRPNIFSDSADVKVVVPNRYNGVGKFPGYKITEVEIPFGDFRNEVNDITGIAVSKDNDLYVTIGRYLYKVLSNSKYEQVGAQLSRAFRRLTDIKFGPDGKLYVAVDDDIIYKLDANTAVATEWAKPDKDIAYFDFFDDGGGNYYLYGGADKGLVRINSEGECTLIGGYTDDYDILSVKVYSGYVYLAIKYSGSWAIWRNEIKSGGSLGEKHVYFDWADAGEFSENEFTSITFDSRGDLIVGIKNTGTNVNTTDPFAVVHPDGSCEAMSMYFNRDILEPTADQFAWETNGRYMYINRGKTIGVNAADAADDRPYRIFRVDMGLF